MSTPITWVDAFSAVPFAGNPAAVCVLDRPMADDAMQSLAFELGIAETAYVTPTDDPHTFGLRWFSPATEIDLCGHATLASAHALRQSGRVDGTAPLTFHTRSGPLIASFEAGAGTDDGDGTEGRISLDFPADPITPGPVPDALQGQWPDDEVTQSGLTGFFAFVALRSAAAVRDYVPDLRAIADAGTKALLLTAPADLHSDDDYVLRVFGPNVGIDEDPATGSAQCSAGPYWAEVLGRDQLRARQLSPRGARLYVRPAGERVHIAGAATTVLRGHLC
jgi:PhzF family phenazine biosynthesis protein